MVRHVSWTLLICLRYKWETYLPLKTSFSIVQTKYESLIFRKQVLLQQIKYINKFINSYSLQNIYIYIFFANKTFLRYIFCNITFWSDSTLSI